MRKIFLVTVSCTIIILLFWPFHFDADNDRLIRLIMNAMHFPAFFLFTGTLLISVPHPCTKKTFWIITICVGIFIIMVEVLQPFSGRSASTGDAFGGLLGMVSVLGGYFIWHHSRRQLFKVLYCLCISGIIIYLAFPISKEIQTVCWRQNQFPLLGDFENKTSLQLWRRRGASGGRSVSTKLSDAFASNGRQSLRIQTGRENWAGIKYIADGSDWNLYSILAFDLYNPAESFTLYLQIADEFSAAANYRSRFNKAVLLHPGWNYIRLTMSEIRSNGAGRPLNLRAIKKIIFAAGKNPQPRVWYMDYVRLIANST